MNELTDRQLLFTATVAALAVLAPSIIVPVAFTATLIDGGATLPVALAPLTALAFPLAVCALFVAFRG